MIVEWLVLIIIVSLTSTYVADTNSGIVSAYHPNSSFIECCIVLSKTNLQKLTQLPQNH